MTERLTNYEPGDDPIQRPPQPEQAIGQTTPPASESRFGGKVVLTGFSAPESTPQAPIDDAEASTEPEPETSPEPTPEPAPAKQGPTRAEKLEAHRKQKEREKREKLQRKDQRRSFVKKALAGTAVAAATGGMLLSVGSALSGPEGREETTQSDYAEPTSEASTPKEAIPSPREEKNEPIKDGVEAGTPSEGYNFFASDRLTWLQMEGVDIDQTFRPYTITGIDLEKADDGAAPLSELTLKTYVVNADGSLSYKETAPELVIDKREQAQTDEYGKDHVTFYIPDTEEYTPDKLKNIEFGVQLEDKNETAAKQPDVNVAVLKPVKTDSGALAFELLPKNAELNG